MKIETPPMHLGICSYYWGVSPVICDTFVEEYWRLRSMPEHIVLEFEDRPTPEGVRLLLQERYWFYKGTRKNACPASGTYHGALQGWLQRHGLTLPGHDRIWHVTLYEVDRDYRALG